MPVGAPVIEEQVSSATRTAPRWKVILLNDDDHTYDYVIEMLMKLFAKTLEEAFRHAEEVDATGVTVLTLTTRERAELKQEQIHGYGRDHRLARSKGSMSAAIEPVE